MIFYGRMLFWHSFSVKISTDRIGHLYLGGIDMKNLRMCLAVLAIVALGSGASLANSSDPAGAVGINNAVYNREGIP